MSCSSWCAETAQQVVATTHRPDPQGAADGWVVGWDGGRVAGTRSVVEEIDATDHCGMPQPARSVVARSARSAFAGPGCGLPSFVVSD